MKAVPTLEDLRAHLAAPDRADQALSAAFKLARSETTATGLDAPNRPGQVPDVRTIPPDVGDQLPGAGRQ